MPITPGPTAPTDDPEQNRVLERNSFFHSLSDLARSRFLEALESAVERGATQEEAWREAALAAQTAYSRDNP